MKTLKGTVRDRASAKKTYDKVKPFLDGLEVYFVHQAESYVIVADINGIVS